MKKFTTTINKKDKQQTVGIYVDNTTAQALNALSDSELHDYIVDEHEIYLSNLRAQRKCVSYENCVENGVPFVNDGISFEDEIIHDEQVQELLKALATLPQEQKWLIRELYFKKRSHRSVAKQFGISEQAISGRLERIFAKLKKNLAVAH